MKLDEYRRNLATPPRRFAVKVDGRMVDVADLSVEQFAKLLSTDGQKVYTGLDIGKGSSKTVVATLHTKMKKGDLAKLLGTKPNGHGRKPHMVEGVDGDEPCDCPPSDHWDCQGTYKMGGGTKADPDGTFMVVDDVVEVETSAGDRAKIMDWFTKTFDKSKK